LDWTQSWNRKIDFKIVDSDEIIKVFTTRADTSFGITAMIIAPEHSLLKKITTKENQDKINSYVDFSKKRSEFERTQLEKEKTGVFTGSYCINPVNNEKIPIWVSDYVIATYGGGAVMIVPAHDKRDYAFAKKYDVDIREVVSGGDISKEPYTGYGKLINSEEFNGLSSKEAIEKITDWLIKNKVGQRTINYKLRDWVFSRQHYWGEPIPIVHCEKCGIVTVPEKDLPVELPHVEKYEPTDTGESPFGGYSRMG